MLEYRLSEGGSECPQHYSEKQITRIPLCLRRPIGNGIAEINSACSSDLFPGIDSIKISFMCCFFLPQFLLPLLLHKILIT